MSQLQKPTAGRRHTGNTQAIPPLRHHPHAAMRPALAPQSPPHLTTSASLLPPCILQWHTLALEWTAWGSSQATVESNNGLDPLCHENVSISTVLASGWHRAHPLLAPFPHPPTYPLIPNRIREFAFSGVNRMPDVAAPTEIAGKKKPGHDNHSFNDKVKDNQCCPRAKQ